MAREFNGKTNKQQTKNMKPTLVPGALSLFLAIAPNLHAQDLAGNPGAPAVHTPYYRPLTLAPAADEPAGGGGGGQAKADEDKGGLSAEELAKIAQNPVANMISVPFQNNFNFDVGPRIHGRNE